LRDAASYITKLPKAEHSAPEWQAAMEALILVAESGGPTMLARIGVMRGVEPSRRAGVQSRSQRDTLGQAQAEERPMTVLIYVDTSKQVGDPDHLKVFANADAACQAS
jgi:LmbE family N-acetylglucosaminyl deacetylase